MLRCVPRHELEGLRVCFTRLTYELFTICHECNRGHKVVISEKMTANKTQVWTVTVHLSHLEYLGRSKQRRENIFEPNQKTTP